MTATALDPPRHLDDGERGHPRRWATLAVMCLAVFVTVLDGTIVNVALPTLAVEFERDHPSAAVDRRRLPARVHRPAARGRRAR